MYTQYNTAASLRASCFDDVYSHSHHFGGGGGGGGGGLMGYRPPHFSSFSYFSFTNLRPLQVAITLLEKSVL